MAQWEDKLGAILNDPQTMGRILSIAQSLEGGGETPGQPADPPTAEAPAAATPTAAKASATAEVSAPKAAPPPEAGPAPDPRLMAAGLRALSAWQGPDDNRTALLQALRPFLKSERHDKLDRAVRITRLTRVVRAALDAFRGEEGDV